MAERANSDEKVQKELLQVKSLRMVSTDSQLECVIRLSEFCKNLSSIEVIIMKSDYASEILQ